MLEDDLLVREIEARAPSIARTVYLRMYEDPFWEARFGRKGHYHTERDGNYHLTYLVQALRAQSPSIMTQYAQWVRSLLVTRGMCSSHLVENFAALSGVLAEEALPDVERAQAMLRAAADALTYPRGVPAAIDRVAPGLVLELAGEGEMRSARDIVRHLSFLADSIALARPELLREYVEFIEGWRGEPEAFRATLAAIEAALREEIDAASMTAVRAHLDAALGRSR
jgi:hypothetical protein